MTTAEPARPPISRSALVAFTTGIIGLGAALATSILIGRSLGPAGKGSYDIMSATAMLLSVGLGLSLSGGISYGVARRLAHPRSLLRTVYAFVLVQFCLAVVVLGALRLVLPSFVPPNFGDLALVATAALVGLGSLASYLRGMLVGRELIARASWLDLSARVAVAMAVLLVVAAAQMTLVRLDYVMVLSATAVASVVSCVAYRVGLRPILDGPSGPRGVRVVLGFALPSYLGNLVQFLNYRLDLFLVSAFAGIAAVGIYALAASLSQMVWLVTNPIALVLLPRVAAETGGPSVGTDLGRVSRVSLLLSVVSAAGLAVLGPSFIGFAYGEPFHAATLQLLVLLPGVALFGLVNVLAAYIGGIGRPNLNLLVALGGFVATLALDLALIPTLGGLGAALASTLSYSISAGLTVVVAVRVGHLSARDLVVPTRDDVRQVLLGVSWLFGRRPGTSRRPVRPA